MTDGVYPNVPLNVVSVTLAKDARPTPDAGLPVTYSVLLGLSRPISAYELVELGAVWPGVTDASDRHWLVVPNTTIDEVQGRLPGLQNDLAGVEARAAVVQAASESLAAGEKAAWARRMGVVSEINKSLEPYRRPGRDQR